MRTGPIEIEQAREIVMGCVEPLGEETVALSEALGRVLAEDIRSEEDVPGFDSSAMDGFALRSADVTEASAAGLAIVGESRAGHPSDRIIESGQAIAISTGAAIPVGADAVVPVEQTNHLDGLVQVLGEVEPGANIRRAGEDMRAGETALAAGAMLGPAELGVLASIGCAAPHCFRRPRVGILVTGDELVEPGEPLGRGAIYNSNAHSIAALVREAGGLVTGRASVRDDPLGTRAAIASALESAEVLVICGGVSVGEHDHVKASLAELGVSERFWGIALKPGKPTWFGTHGRTLVFGLPGNPVSAMVTFALLAAPAVLALGGAPADCRRTSATITRDYDKQPGRAHAVRCRLSRGDSGWLAEPTGPQGSHILTSMLGADALAMIPSASGPVSAGEQVEVELLRAGAVRWA
jgi:molybdopterin molybdotransferase